ncbi:MAG: SulP family inorganic anion transporter [Oscillospiraceae bacterium]|nr:SulP family inorganic anion transporter [Oscillospiraceae bacterium]
MIKNYIHRLKTEFENYNAGKFGKDVMSGITVAAVALPLALAFGVSSGADAAAGLITAIIAGFIISAFSGASFQISGPTGAMTAVLITIVSKYKLQGVFIVSMIAGIILLIAGICKLGKIVNIIPSPVVTGFTSGIAIIIALGQIDNFFGTVSRGDTVIEKLTSYGSIGFSPNAQAVITGLIVIAVMVLWPKKWNTKIPSSFIGIIIAALASNILGFDVATVGAIPKTFLPPIRLDIAAIDLKAIPQMISPAITIAALGMIESLLCGASASRMKNESFDADQELIAQGIGNIIIPFFGGVPATAAIARTSVAIKSGCQTRLTGIFHAVGLLLSMFLLSDIMSKLPLSALAGVLIVTAWRMNEWHSIKYIFRNKFKSAAAQFLVTMACTVIFDLTIAIIIGVLLAMIIFVINAITINISLSEAKRANTAEKKPDNDGITLVYVTGIIFFANIEKLKKKLSSLDVKNTLIVSMRGVSGVDMNGALGIIDIISDYSKAGKKIIFCGLQNSVKQMIERVDVSNDIPRDCCYSNTDKAFTEYAEA